MADLLQGFNDRLRTLFGIRRSRRKLPTGAKPKIGGLVVKGQRSMDVTRTLTDEQWGWLVLMGWCSVDRRKERRQYFPLPKNACELLAEVSPQEREALLDRLLLE